MSPCDNFRAYFGRRDRFSRLSRHTGRIRTSTLSPRARAERGVGSPFSTLGCARWCRRWCGCVVRRAISRNTRHVLVPTHAVAGDARHFHCQRDARVTQACDILRARDLPADTHTRQMGFAIQLPEMVAARRVSGSRLRLRKRFLREKHKIKGGKTSKYSWLAKELLEFRYSLFFLVREMYVLRKSRCWLVIFLLTKNLLIRHIFAPPSPINTRDAS